MRRVFKAVLLVYPRCPLEPGSRGRLWPGNTDDQPLDGISGDRHLLRLLAAPARLPGASLPGLC